LFPAKNFFPNLTIFYATAGNQSEKAAEKLSDCGSFAPAFKTMLRTTLTQLYQPTDAAVLFDSCQPSGGCALRLLSKKAAARANFTWK
jgi:hypothetical protein